jgi:GTP-binding protein EngB required for normal cell division
MKILTQSEFWQNEEEFLSSASSALTGISGNSDRNYLIVELYKKMLDALYRSSEPNDKILKVLAKMDKIKKEYMESDWDFVAKSGVKLRRAPRGK